MAARTRISSSPLSSLQVLSQLRREILSRALLRSSLVVRSSRLKRRQQRLALSLVADAYIR
jgi:hypothetical protein